MFGFPDIDVTADGADLNNDIDHVEIMLQSVTNATAGIGATSKRVAMQSQLVRTLRDAVTKSMGRLVDADMNEASTRLKVVTAQQQLGVQALSIANSNSQNILQLLR